MWIGSAADTLDWFHSWILSTSADAHTPASSFPWLSSHALEPFLWNDSFIPFILGNTTLFHPSSAVGHFSPPFSFVGKKGETHVPLFFFFIRPFWFSTGLPD